MNIVQLPRRGGKTTYTIDWLRAQPKRVLIVPNTGMKRILQDAHADLAHRIVSADTFSRYGARGVFPPGTEIGIDELDMVLSTLLSIFGASGQVSIATLTPSDHQPSLFGEDPEPHIPSYLPPTLPPGYDDLVYREPQIAPNAPQPFPGDYYPSPGPQEVRHDYRYRPQSPYHWTVTSSPTNDRVTLFDGQATFRDGEDF